MKTTKSASASDKALAAVRATMKPESIARIDKAIKARAATIAALQAATVTVKTSMAPIFNRKMKPTGEKVTVTVPNVGQPQAPEIDASVPTLDLPEIPFGATHFRLTRKMLEIASDVRHLAADLAALGQREGDKLEFGTLSASGNFTSNAKALRDPNAPAQVRGTGKMLLIDSLIIEGTHTAKSVAAQVVAKFGGDEVKTLVIVRSRPWHLKKAGKLAADRVPFAKAVSVKKAAKVVAAAARASMEYGA